MHRRLRLTTHLLLLLLFAVLSSQAFAARPAQHDDATERVKLLIDNEDKAALDSARQSHGRLLADYGSFSLWLVERAATAHLNGRATVSSPADFDTIYLRDGVIERSTSAQTPPVELSSSRQTGPQLWIVQFVGPIAAGWLEDLVAQGAALVSYMPNHAYVIWADGPTIAAIEEQIASGASPLQWSGPYHPAYRLAPQLAGPARQATDDSVDVTVQIYTTDAAADTLARLLALSEAQLAGPEQLVGFTTVAVRLRANRLAEVAGWADVFNVEPYVAPQLNDEIQGQILAGNISGGGASGPGYLAWLQSKDVPTNPALYPVVDVVDDGVDNGTTTPNHADFYLNGNPASSSRLVANSNCTSDASASGGAGHGNLNAGIVGGYNDGTGAAYEDAAGYNYGLGISPWTRLANTKIFRDSGSFDIGNCNDTYTGIVRASHENGAAISTNSWGADVYGAYGADSQAYDSLTRDARPDLPGLQPMLHIFSAGNAGPSGQTLGSPGTAKNVLTVGAGENPRANGFVDGCGSANADNYNDITGFSSRGPTRDQRVKPDLVAPGNHVTGPASQIPNYDGTGVCTKYYPSGQTLYALSSGTSHSAPAVAGAASLLYVRYQALFGAAPSPAMLKAFLLNSTRYLDGVSSGGNLPSNSQGWGGMDLSVAFDAVARQAVDQTVTFGETGEEVSYFLEVADSGRPIRITLAWSDAPGSTTGASYVNDLDLRVIAGGQTYLGNVFSGPFSTTGGSADQRNNVEQVILPAGTTGQMQIIVRAANIAGDGLPGNADLSDQDFALFATNLAPTNPAVLTGTVRRSNGDPIANAIVSVDSFSTQTDASGAYTLHTFPGTYVVTASKMGFATQSINGVTLSTSAPTTLDFTLLGGSVSGVVRSAFSPPTPIAGATITAGGFTAITGADGSYSLNLAPGNYTISAVHPTYATVSGDITVGDLQELTYDITMPGGALIGTVVDQANGAPLAGVAVGLSGPANFNISTNADGQYAQILPPGSYTVTLSKPGYATATLSGVTVTSGITTTADASLLPHLEVAPAALERTLAYGAVITDTGLLELTNNDVVPLDVSLSEQAGGFTPLAADAVPWLSQSQDTVTIPGGATAQIDIGWHADLHPPQPGVYTARLAISSPGRPELSRSLPVTLTVEPTTTMGRIDGRILSSGVCAIPTPLAGALVELGTTPPSTLVTDANGAYTVYLEPGSYSVTISAADHVPSSATLTVTTGATTADDRTLVLQKPCAEPSPTSIEQTVEMGQSATASLAVANSGTTELRFNATPIIGETSSYTWESISYSWQDASDGTDLALTDEGEANITLPFAFPFYGEAITALRIGNNGAILAGATSGEISYSNRRLDEGSTPNWLIAPFWDDIDDDTGKVTWKVEGAAPNRRVIIQWSDRPHYSQIGAATFQALLEEDGRIIYKYKDVDFGDARYNFGASATVGVRGPDAATSAQYSYNASSLQNEMALCFRPASFPSCGSYGSSSDGLSNGWLSVSPRSGMVGPGGNQNLSVGFDASGYDQPGVYTATLLLTHNTPQPALRVPVTMNVVAPANYGRVSGTISGNGQCGPPALPLAGAGIAISGATSVSLTSDGQGGFEYWLPAGSYTAVITATGYLTQSLELAVPAGGELFLNPTLGLDAPCATVAPETLLSSQPPDSVVTRTLTIANHGAAELTWSLGCPSAPSWASVNLAAGSLAAGEDERVTVSFDSSGLGIGVYSGELCLQSNDPSTPSLSIPLTLAVSSFGVSITPATDTRTANPGAAASYTLSVTNTGSYTDTFDVAVAGNSWATTPATDTLTIGPGQSAELQVSVAVPASAGPDDQDTATVTVTSRGSAVANASATLTTGVSLTDNTPPTAALAQIAPLKAGGATLTLSVTYKDSSGLDLASLGTGNIRVAGPNGFSQLATLVSVGEAEADGSRTVTYTITAPGGSWDPTDNGIYTVTLLAGQVRDMAGNAMAAAELGSFSVSIPYQLFLPVVAR